MKKKSKRISVLQIIKAIDAMSAPNDKKLELLKQIPEGAILTSKGAMLAFSRLQLKLMMPTESPSES